MPGRVCGRVRTSASEAGLPCLNTPSVTTVTAVIRASAIARPVAPPRPCRACAATLHRLTRTTTPATYECITRLPARQPSPAAPAGGAHHNQRAARKRATVNSLQKVLSCRYHCPTPVRVLTFMAQRVKSISNFVQVHHTRFFFSPPRKLRPPISARTHLERAWPTRQAVSMTSCAAAFQAHKRGTPSPAQYAAYAHQFLRGRAARVQGPRLRA